MYSTVNPTSAIRDVFHEQDTQLICANCVFRCNGMKKFRMHFQVYPHHMVGPLFNIEQFIIGYDWE